MLKKLSLRARLTLLSAAIIISVAAILTATSMFSANRIFVQDMQQSLIGNIVPISDSDIAALTPADENSIATFTPNDNDQDGELISSDGYTIQQILYKAEQRFNLWGFAGLFIVALLGVGATWFMAGRALKPVKELSAAIEEINGSNLSRRVDAHGMQDEIGHLAHSFNSMMDKVSASFERQQRFSANAAHELKTPLATMQVNLEVLELDDDPEPERMKKALSVAKINTERMIHLMNDLFLLSTDEVREFSDEIPVSELFSEILSELSPFIQQKQVIASYSAKPSLMLFGNRTLLYRALFNLTENAVKYNQEGGSLSLSAHEENNSVVVRVADTGICIPAKDMEHIFEPFYRVEPSRSRAMGGSGLGLALVHDIVERHGGSVHVESTPGRGTTFTLRFSLSEAVSVDTLSVDYQTSKHV